MTRPEQFSAVRYLTAKAAVDERSLNPRVFDALAQGIAGVGGRPIHVLELGAGVGSTFRRMRESGLVTRGSYLMVDLDAESLAEASRTADAFQDPDKGVELVVGAIVSDAVSYLRRQAEVGRFFDVIIAQALVDLLNLPQFLEAAANALRPGGLLYLPITFDGQTTFEPPPDRELDARIIDAYHRTMDERRTPDGLPTGGSRAGRALLTELSRAGLEIVEAGASDWVVYPQDGGYPEDVAYFLHHVVNFVWDSLSEHSTVFSAGLEEWVGRRHRQIERGELIYMAHQLDVLARKAG